MYSTLSTDSIHIQMMQDLLFIELDDAAHVTEYVVKNEEDKTIRKGRFTGPAIQLNLTHLPSGNYLLGLNHEDEVRTYYFEKNGEDYFFSGLYKDNSMSKLFA